MHAPGSDPESPPFSPGTRVARRGRWKLLSLAALLALIATLPTDGRPWWGGCPVPIVLAALTTALGLAGHWGRVSWGGLARRWLVVLPGVLLLGGLVVATHGWQAGGGPAGLVVWKAWLSLTGLLILIETTTFDELLVALAQCGLPATLRNLIAQTHRYTHLYRAELHTLCRAQAARTFHRPSRWSQWLGAPLGMALVRALDRAERTHAAMLARGLGSDPPRSMSVAERAMRRD